MAAVDETSFDSPTHLAIYAAVSELGRDRAVSLSAAAWVDQVARTAPEEVRSIVVALSVADIHARREPETGDPEQRYVDEIVFRMQELACGAPSRTRPWRCAGSNTTIPRGLGP